MDTFHDFDFAIIGGGATGVLLALALLPRAAAGQRVALIEPGTPGQGVAYATGDAAHLLNVPAGNMSAFAARPDDFTDYLTTRDGKADAAAFMPRRDYAAYLGQRLAEARAASAAELTHLAASATAIQPESGRFHILLDDGGRLAAGRVALATGNHPRMLPFPAEPARVLAAWDEAAIARIGAEDDLAILGSGLSMVDVVLSLDARGHRGRISVVSRHGLLPLPHPPRRQTLDIDIHALEALSLRQRLGALRAAAREAARQGIGWQALMDALRHHVRPLWRSLDAAGQRRFLRHAARHWDVHRHRIAPVVAARLQARIDDGRLRVWAARIADVATRDDGLALDLRLRGGGRQRLSTAWLVNASGIETRAEGFDDALLGGLLASGLARPGPHGLGFDTDEDGALIDAAGRAHPRLHAIGSPRLGTLWESTAIPDLRIDAAALAERWLASP
ncbi:pyridine nucleotide-disulfide oxidoreductase [Lysobacter pythonis]|uniref:Pyridine nucleotide-disulfide oxidoreductase n=1 Tax=Solilutibacter pythonis TaxID=2483112 RepID=A0A3M2HDZ4_9GAMM|nr:FAD/NAD(P)-binding protein [Lysobacter pythonis]RMH87931.1 pyridine nucleotide-disulfide oxidoreductase [Lysobacter pythonis]